MDINRVTAGNSLYTPNPSLSRTDHPASSNKTLQRQRVSSEKASNKDKKSGQEKDEKKSSPKTAVIDRGGTQLYVDKPTKRIVAQILDKDRDVIKQIPPEEQLRILRRAREVEGVLFDERA